MSDLREMAAREAMVEPSRPEPPPACRGVPVPPALLGYLEALGEVPGTAERACGLIDAYRLVQERDAFGRQKYGQPLMSDDGRGVEDLRQELGDALLYAWRERMRGTDLSGCARLLRVLLEVVEGR